MGQHAIADNGREILHTTTPCPLVGISLNVDNQHYSDDSITTKSTPATIFVTESPVLLVIVVQRISRSDVIVWIGQRTLRSAFPGFPAVPTTLWHRYDGLISQLTSVKLSDVSDIIRGGTDLILRTGLRPPGLQVESTHRSSKLQLSYSTWFLSWAETSSF